MTFKHFTEKVYCRVVPVTKDRRVWLDEKVADDELYNTAISDRFVEVGEQYDDFAHVSGRILRLTFQGEATYAPLLGTVARETGVDYSILAGRIDRIKDNPYGQLTLALTGGDIDAALARFQAADVHLEVLR